MNYDLDRWRGNEFDYNGLEDLADRSLAEGMLMSDLDEHIEKDIAGMPFVDWESEKLNPSIQKYVADLALVLADGESSEEIGHITRLSYHFGHVVSDTLLGRPTSVGVEAMAAIKPGVGCVELRESLEKSVSDYLSDRRNIYGIIGAFVQDIDLTNNYYHLVELAAGSTMMYIDHALSAKTEENVASCFREITENF